MKMGLSLQVERMWIVLYLLCPSRSQTLASYCMIMTSLNEHLAMTSSEDMFITLPVDTTSQIFPTFYAALKWNSH